MSFEAPRGMRDFLPEDMRIRNWIFDTWRQCAELSSFDQYDGCVVETQELLVRKAGEEVVDQIYAFKDKSDRELALRPEMTPSLARMINSQGKALPLPAKWFGIFQCFRYERMTLGRKREHYQWNLDIIGQADVTAEAEVLRTALSSVERFGLTSDVLKIRVGSRKLLAELLEKLKFDLSHFMDACMVLDKRGKVDDSVLKEMLTAKGVSANESEILFKVLELKNLNDVEAILGAESVALIEIKKLFRLMEFSGYGEFMTFDIAVIRGLAYYTGIVFEAFDVKGRHRAIFGGGRYDNLLASLGGDSQPCVGLGFGDVVIYELMKDEGLIKNTNKQVDVTIAYMDVSGEEVAVKAASLCRKSGLTVNLALEPQKPKKIFAQADKHGARFVYLIGPDEAKTNSGNLKNLKTGEQSQIEATSLTNKIKYFDTIKSFSSLDNINLNTENSKIIELEKVILTKGSWTIIMFMIQEKACLNKAYTFKKYLIRKYQKKKKIYYQQKNELQIEDNSQAKQICEVLKSWINLYDMNTSHNIDKINSKQEKIKKIIIKQIKLSDFKLTMYKELKKGEYNQNIISISPVKVVIGQKFNLTNQEITKQFLGKLEYWSDLD